MFLGHVCWLRHYFNHLSALVRHSIEEETGERCVPKGTAVQHFWTSSITLVNMERNFELGTSSTYH